MTNLDPMRMGTRLARNWWTVALRGAIAIIFGLAALFWPDITLTALILIFAAFVLVSGVLLAIAAFRDGLTHTHGWLMLLEGAIGMAIGVMAFIWPGITALVLLYLIAAWAIVTGVLEIIAAIQVRKEIENEWLLALAGIASVMFGVLLIIWPIAGALAILWIIAAYAIIFGVLLLILAFRLRRWGTERSIF
ncbi:MULTISPECIES: HdeD family acid-resistance protein [unclassified Nodularia (in: cyanobacteria)]|uniref:HdeD family acid-resistance protein n=1 Tax=unclassified Nodularia (in: cyanobacteria) TaxID=2656917 RepID=UPI001880D0FD|nr:MULTISPECIES: HdeD family acid-resistance protein [unclassified Nodularia (in: cyanobacteria)]MBE9197597.1 HdeD family acid-resistance protein [Nodularia sp. LEGE 06071]MCC2692102.1 HdeD family acid-resistance protein [Nodularia sp. LEGE 04288]